MSTRRAVADADALDLANGEALVHQISQADSPGDDVAAGIAGRQIETQLVSQALERFGLDERDLLARLLGLPVGSRAVGVAITDEPDSGHRFSVGNRLHRRLGRRCDEDAFDSSL